MNNIALRRTIIAFLYFLLGVTLGYGMGMAEDFRFAHLHAHINLIGFASLALCGLVYRAYPALASTRLAGVHFWAANIGAPIFLAGLLLIVLTGNPIGAIVGGFIYLVSVTVFVVNLRHAAA